MPERVIESIAQHKGTVNIIDLCKDVLNGYIPSFVEAYHEKLATII